MRRAGAILAMALLSGCASYAPAPLSDLSDTLPTPVASVLETRASAIDRPFLAPVEVDLSAPLTGDAIAALAVANNPDLIAERTRAGVSQAQAFAAGLLPDPTFSAGVSTVLSGPDSLLDLSGALGLDIGALRTRMFKRELAIAQDRQVRLDLAWSEWQTAGKARLEAARVTYLQGIVALAEESRDLAQDQLDRVARAAGRGDLAGDRLQAARLSVLSASETLRNAQSDLAAARVELRRLLGLPADYPLDLAPVDGFAAPPPAETLFTLARGNRTDLAALRAGYDAQQASVHQAILDQFPNLAISLNGARDSGGNLLVGPSVDFTLPLWNRNRGAIAVERATREALRAEYEARLFQTRADIAAAEAVIAVAREARAQALSAMPELERYAQATRRAAERGDLSLETAENARQTLRDRQVQLAQAEQALAEQMIALELLTGTPREGWPS